MKTQEQRIKDAAAVLVGLNVSGPSAERWARDVLEAADHEPPKWPTDESVHCVHRPEDEEWEESRQYLREALLADPIIKAAVALRRFSERREYARMIATDEWYRATAPLFEAIDEAGL